MTSVRENKSRPSTRIEQSPEDAPAPSALHSFKTHITDGKVVVTADVSRTVKGNNARAPPLVSPAAVPVSKGVVIVGGGAGTLHAIESLREVKLPCVIFACQLPTLNAAAWVFG